jgi:hypothetical protein
MRPKTTEREQARELRRQGLTYAEIAEQLTVAKSTVSLWVRDLPKPTTAAEDYASRMSALRKYHDERRRRVFMETENQKLAWANMFSPLTQRELLIAGAVAYWAEGSKSKPWRRSETVAFINSDPGMIRLFMNWLSLAGVQPHRCSFRVQLHESADLAKAEAFWADVVGVSPARFERATIKRHRPKTARHNTGDDYHGCLVVRVHQGAEIYRQIEGIWWAVRHSPRSASAGPDLTDGVVAPAAPNGLHPRLARFRWILRQGRGGGTTSGTL